ncbi:MAG: hypothetical protein WBG43_12645 [Marinifilaceae bacterium]
MRKILFAILCLCAFSCTDKDGNLSGSFTDNLIKVMTTDTKDLNEDMGLLTGDFSITDLAMKKVKELYQNPLEYKKVLTEIQNLRTNVKKQLIKYDAVTKKINDLETTYNSIYKLIGADNIVSKGYKDNFNATKAKYDELTGKVESIKTTMKIIDGIEVAVKAILSIF